MGLFDSILGKVLDGSGGQGVNYGAILQWIEQQGGLQAIVDKTRQGPLGSIVNSWVGTGENQPVTGDHISQMFSSSAIEPLAKMLGVNTNMASTLLSQVLPHLINSASPEGKVSSNVSLTDIAGKLFS